VALGRGGVVSNLDLKSIDPATRFKASEKERQAAVLDDAKEKARKAPGSGFGVYLPGELDEKDSVQQRAISALDERGIAAEASLKPRAAVVDPSAPGGFTWQLNEKQREAVIEGYYCPNCLQRQSDPANQQCQWAYATTDIKGCSFNRLVDDFVR
jgi:hypothetical protein